MVRYEIHFKTGDNAGAGTDATVLVILYGKAGNTISYISPVFGDFDSPRNDFEIGQLDRFTLPIDIPSDDIYAIRVSIAYDDNNPGDNPEWFLEYIRLISDEINKVFTFPCNQWLGTKMAPNHTKEYTLYEGALLHDERIPVTHALAMHDSNNIEKRIQVKG
ncbi:PLAT/LH2 domain-containing protein [Bacillus thuringiensis]|nr:PLAT/LH2 domain-containing protein [Bacillus thuringiensis]